jgi:hypothetical protein
MVDVFTPIIRPEEYEAFRAILDNEIPDTYNEWRDLILDRGNKMIADGERPIGIDVNPHEFAAWLPTRWDQRTANGLFAFAQFKARNPK